MLLYFHHYYTIILMHNTVDAEPVLKKTGHGLSFTSHPTVSPHLQQFLLGWQNQMSTSMTKITLVFLIDYFTSFCILLQFLFKKNWNKTNYTLLIFMTGCVSHHISSPHIQQVVVGHHSRVSAPLSGHQLRTLALCPGIHDCVAADVHKLTHLRQTQKSV